MLDCDCVCFFEVSLKKSLESLCYPNEEEQSECGCDSEDTWEGLEATHPDIGFFYVSLSNSKHGTKQTPNNTAFSLGIQLTKLSI